MLTLGPVIPTEGTPAVQGKGNYLFVRQAVDTIRLAKQIGRLTALLLISVGVNAAILVALIVLLFTRA